MKLVEKIKMDLIADSKDRHREAVLSLLEKDEDAFVVDMGCSDGWLTRLIINQIGTKEQALGLDIRAEDDGTNELRTTKWDLNESPLFNEQSVDVVTAVQLIEHLWNTDVFLREVYRILKPAGYAVISTPNLASWHNFVSLLFGRQPPILDVSDEMRFDPGGPAHRRVFTTTELIRLLEFHNFRIEKVISTSYFPLLGKPATLLIKLDWRHAGYVTVKARKEA